MKKGQARDLINRILASKDGAGEIFKEAEESGLDPVALRASVDLITVTNKYELLVLDKRAGRVGQYLDDFYMVPPSTRSRRQSVKSRIDYEAQSLSRTKPWEAEGISRRTWYRRQKG